MGGANSVTIALPNSDPLGRTQAPTSNELKEDIPTARMITPTHEINVVSTEASVISNQRSRRVVTFQSPEKVCSRPLSEESSSRRRIQEEEYSNRRQRQGKVENMVHEEFERDITQFYELRDSMVLGRGNSGAVIVCVHLETGIEYALKTLHKDDITDDPDALSKLRQEIRMMAELDHPNIIRVHECFEDDFCIRIVLELCRGGELHDRLNRQVGNRFTEKNACKHVHTMVSAISYVHAHGIAFRDIKLENFLFESDSEDSPLKLVDFGLSQYNKENELMDNAVGTPYYLAPEVLTGPYTIKCDVWSMGVIAYMLISGLPPFSGDDEMEILTAVFEGKLVFHEEYFGNISPSAKNFIAKCLNRDVSQRPCAKDLLKHEWFKLLDEEPACPSANVLAHVLTFEKKSALTRLCMEVVAHSLTATQITGLREQFNILDVNDTGEITFSDLKNMLQRLAQLGSEDIGRICAEATDHDKSTIKYHEFIAASLSRRAITESNLKIAFEKLSNHHEEVTIGHIRDLMGKDASADEVDNMMKDAHFDPARGHIDYSAFKTIVFDGEKSPSMNSPDVCQWRKGVSKHEWKAAHRTSADSNMYKSYSTWQTG